MGRGRCCSDFRVAIAPDDEPSPLPSGLLYLGSMRLVSTVWQRKLLASELCVRRVLNVTREVVGTENDNAFVSLRISVRDRPTEDLDLSTACAFIDAAIQAGEPCLVHCRQGASRSATVIQLGWQPD